MMDDKRRGEIALMLVERELMKERLHAPNDFHRIIGNIAKEIGIDSQELLDFYQSMLPKMIGMMLGDRKAVSITIDG
jgi:hypothetical protein